MDDIERVKIRAETMKLDNDNAVELVRKFHIKIKIQLLQQKMLIRGVEKTFVQEKTTESATDGKIDITEGINMATDAIAGGTQTRSDQQVTLSETGDDPYIRDIIDQLKKRSRTIN